MTLTFGNVPYPAVTTHIIWNQAWDDLGPRFNIGVVYHRMLGSLMGTEQYFDQGAAGLTHYGTGHPGDHDGEIRMWCDPRTNRAPWASGPVKAPWGDGPAFVAKYGVNAVNNDLIAIEISGGYNDPMSDTTKDTIAALTAYWADQGKVPWDVYPLNPASGLTFTYWHQEFTGPAEKICPGPVVMNATDDIIARTKAMLKQYQAEEKPPMPTVTYPDGFDAAICKAIFANPKYPQYQYSEGQSVSSVWLADKYFCALAYHFLDKSSGRELFAFSNGQTIGRLKSGESFRTLPV